MLTPDPRKRPDIKKIITILENWNEIDDIPLNDDAFKIKNKQEAISKAKNTKYTDIAHTDLLGFDSPIKDSHINSNSSHDHPAFKHSHSVGAPHVPPPVSTGWADFGKRTSVNIADDTQNMFDFGNFVEPEKQTPKEDNSWFDYKEGFGTNKAQTQINTNASVPETRLKKEEKKEDATWGYFDFSDK
mmetsp:Transcript_19099/g.16926  ORF Transcript_19099/g.16926 Transcript_19099/m.16926 type:complete len:187 (+) Transcript_19099:252-812(+)